MENNLFKDAVADAKLVRQLAIETAKQSLAETFTPKIKSMLATKLQEENEELDEVEFDETAAPVVAEEETTTTDEDINLDELIAELEATEETPVEEVETPETDETLAENEEAVDLDDELMETEEEEETEDDEEVEVEDEEEQKVEDMTVEELTDLIRDIVAQEQGGGEEDEVGAGEEVEAELEEAAAMKQKKVSGKATKTNTAPYSKLAEAAKTINILRKELNETNLLNAKLLYANKIFKAKSLNESEKMKVINAFDKATNVKETKLVYESLVNAFNKTVVKKQSLKESIGFASKVTGIAKKKEPTSVFDSAAVDRLQKLAGLKPLYN